jgi:Fe-S oxidoreductase
VAPAAAWAPTRRPTNCAWRRSTARSGSSRRSARRRWSPLAPTAGSSSRRGWRRTRWRSR